MIMNKLRNLKITEVLFFGKQVYMVCDKKCHKAWGINGNSNFLKKLFCKAPENPGTYEGGQGKNPLSHNKWCARECERSILVDKEE